MGKLGRFAGGLFRSGILTLLLSAIPPLSGTVHAADSEGCPKRAREFIAAYEFLKGHAEDDPAFSAPSDQKKLAEGISRGCAGAAQRFINGMLLMERAGVAGRDRLRIAQRLAALDDAHADAFLGIFRLNFASDGLDLDLNSSVAISERIGLGLGDVPSPAPAIVLRGFREVSAFCLRSIGDGGIELSRPQCAQIAAEVSEAAARQNDPELGKSFVNTVLLMARTRAPERVGIMEAVSIAQRIGSQYGSAGLDNFRTALAYGSREGGLNLSFRDSVRFAEQMAGR